MTDLLSFATALLYAGLGIYFWRTTWLAPKSAEHAAPAVKPGWERSAVLIPLLLHTGLLYQSLIASAGSKLGLGATISAIAWATVLIYWLENFRYKLEGLQAFVLPVAAVSVLAPIVLPASSHAVLHSELLGFKIHLLIAILAYSLFTIAALHAVLMAMVERRLHGGAASAILRNLPPLLTMEHLLFRIITVGFVLLTLTLASGMLFSEELFHQPLQFTHKNLFAIVSWVIFAALLGGRKVYGWRGRTAIRWIMSGFAVLLLAYIGSKFVLEVILHRT